MMETGVLNITEFADRYYQKLDQVGAFSMYIW